MSSFGVLAAACALAAIAAVGRGAGHAPAQGLPSGVTPEMVERGHTLFNGPARCVLCHGTDGKGTKRGPDLTSGHWVHIHGGYDEIINLVNDGIPNPKEFDRPMPKRGGSKISPDEVRDVAAYAWSISRQRS